MSLLPAFNEPMLWTFPCGLDKKPRNANGFLGAVQGVWWPRAELVGVPTGRKNDFDVLDIDGAAGLRWYERNYDAIPQTRAHSTQRGMHLLFVHAPGLHCSTGRIAPGVDVKAERGYCIWWSREGYPISDAPLSEWPDWLLAEAMRKPRLQVYPSTLPSSAPPDAVVAELTAALFQLDPEDWRSEGSQESYDAWLGLMMACKAAGISEDDWVEWCMGDECYAGDEDEIRRKWEGVPARHADASAAAAMACSGGYAATLPLMDYSARRVCLRRWASPKTPPRDWSPATFPSLRKALGDAEFTYQIARAFAHMAAKGATG